jgi:hypothetical protein
MTMLEPKPKDEGDGLKGDDAKKLDKDQGKPGESKGDEKK